MYCSQEQKQNKHSLSGLHVNKKTLDYTESMAKCSLDACELLRGKTTGFKVNGLGGHYWRNTTSSRKSWVNCKQHKDGSCNSLQRDSRRLTQQTWLQCSTFETGIHANIAVQPSLKRQHECLCVLVVLQHLKVDPHYRKKSFQDHVSCDGASIQGFNTLYTAIMARNVWVPRQILTLSYGNFGIEKANESSN